jgi:hypothetical protein
VGFSGTIERALVPKLKRVVEMWFLAFAAAAISSTICPKICRTIIYWQTQHAIPAADGGKQTIQQIIHGLLKYLGSLQQYIVSIHTHLPNLS